jgi:prolyl-tRNA editing enzyme YbaK/EbsC (Cys-tRNA(Pro) deacylase)
MTGPGNLDWAAASDELIAAPVAAALETWTRAADVLAAAIDPDLADTAEFCARYDVALEDSANCVIIAGRRGDVTRYAACVVLATTRADVNGVVRKRLDARKASFAAMDDAVEHGAVDQDRPVSGQPDRRDAAVLHAAQLDRAVVVIGSGLRRSKIALPSGALADLPGAEVIDGLAG